MKRRRFIQSLAAAFSLPALPALSLQTASAAVPTAAAVPTQARFWAIYMSGLHGECTPQTLQNLLHIPEIDAKRYVGQLIADGVIKPNPIVQRTASNLLKGNDDQLSNTVKERFEMKRQTGAKEVDLLETADASEDLEATAELSEVDLEAERETIIQEDNTDEDGEAVMLECEEHSISEETASSDTGNP